MPKSTVFGALRVLLPVHNRGTLTANFVLHLNELLPDGINLSVVVFDDGCTDETLINVKRVWPSVEVVRLDGNAYWGGAINAISEYIKSQPLSENSIYLLANDDIRFPSNSAFLAGLREVDEDALVCARGLLDPNLNLDSFGNIQQYPSKKTKGIHYNAKTGNFEKATFTKPVNVSDTYAMLTTRAAWLSAPKIPLTIPHYLSDYWFTYNLVHKGFRIVHPDEFICLVSTHSTRNKPGIRYSNWFKNKAQYLQSSLNKTSTSYFPAWIKFLSQKPIYPAVRIKILKLKLNNLAASFLYGKRDRGQGKST